MPPLYEAASVLLPELYPCERNYLLVFSDETVNFFLPLALRAANILLPFGVDMRSLKPCLFLLFFCEGWYVLFIILYIFVKAANIQTFMEITNHNPIF